MKNMGSLKSTSEASQSVFLSVFISCLFPLEYVFTYAVGNQISNSKYLLELIKRRSNFDEWKTSSAKYELIRA